ncbi:Bifunctional inhibitor/lipid-transfer protein/seed storage 2S albumin superfamily protein [Salvia divinorum]|uniref:Bifunctional inhibitor/lipid-transfer protein/seed storage 2S albumin superfamily protein n=1 Tax=Salvia divinorum TaxID=28513 RepID=A0ABD1ID37_SALDI
MRKGVAALFVVVVMAVVVHEAAAVVCNANELAVCAGPFLTGSKPSVNCCSKLKEHQPCFCQYIKNPAFKQYIESPNAGKVATACNVTIPTNC